MTVARDPGSKLPVNLEFIRNLDGTYTVRQYSALENRDKEFGTIVYPRADVKWDLNENYLFPIPVSANLLDGVNCKVYIETN